MDRVLLSVEHRRDVQALLSMAHRIADQRSALEVVRVVYEGIADFKISGVDRSSALREMILEAETAQLEGWVSEAQSEAGAGPGTITIWHKHRWQGVLDVAEAQESTLIVKGLDRGDEGFFHTPDDWRLLRHSPIPIYFHREPCATTPRIVASLDVFDVNHAELNYRILKQASELAGRLEGRLAVITVYPPVRVWIESGLQSEDMLSKLKQDIQNEAAELIAEACSTAGIEAYQQTIVEGNVADELARESHHADVIVMGTKARRGTAAWTVGNTCEKILHKVQANVLVVP